MERKNEKNNNNIEMKAQTISIIIIIILILLGGFMLKKWWDGLGNEKSSGDNEKIEAYVMSQDYMKTYLTNPSSAKYPPYSKVTVIKTGDRYKIEAYVDGKNSLGATIRTKYTMILNKENDGGWTKISCDIE